MELRLLQGRWHVVGIVAVCIACLGMIWEWRQDINSASSQVMSAYSSSHHSPLRLTPDSHQTLSGFLTGANGPLEPTERKQARLAEEARIRTRQLITPDRRNVNCAYMKCIALTYDDGPEPRLTAELLDILKEKQAVATFFVVGKRAQAEAATLKRAIAYKNEIGNHSWSHADLTHLNDEQIRHELDQTNIVLGQLIGTQPKLMRPPMGRYDQRVAEVAHMPVALWSVDPKDWWDRDAYNVYIHAVSSAGRGSIILLHDTHQTTITASSWIIDELQRQGYVLVTVSELFDITESTLPHFTSQRLFYR